MVVKTMRFVMTVSLLVLVLGGLAGAFDEAFNLNDEWKPGKKGE